MSRAKKLQHRRDEFNQFVWNHAVDPFQVQFDTQSPLLPEQQTFFQELLASNNLRDPSQLTQAVASALHRSTEHVHVLLQLVGLTRNKFVQDIKVKVRAEGLNISTSSPAAIVRSDAQLAADYISAHLTRVFGDGTDGVVSQFLLECLNQATWPGYIRQERAKRMGHHAEYRIATTMRAAGLQFDPAEKAEKPLCPDVKIDEMSYDLVSPSRTQASMRVLSTVHTANIGQYGESKDALEVRKAIDAMTRAGDRDQVTLLAFIDGIGFESNSAGLDDVLVQADEFAQFRTIWKVLAIAASKVGGSTKVAVPDWQIPIFGKFAKKYNAVLLDIATTDTGNWTIAGDAKVKVFR